MPRRQLHPFAPHFSDSRDVRCRLWQPGRGQPAGGQREDPGGCAPRGARRPAHPPVQVPAAAGSRQPPAGCLLRTRAWQPEARLHALVYMRPALLRPAAALLRPAGALQQPHGCQDTCRLATHSRWQAAPCVTRRVGHRGWGNLGDGLDIPANVLQLDAVPHDWLLPAVQRGRPPRRGGDHRGRCARTV